jgi:TfoX/Sxy family transcriptional regulator of competence genes
MAYDEQLVERVRAAIGEQPGLDEKRMFGGVGFLVRGNMACGVNKDRLIVRVGPHAYQEALARTHVEPFDMTGRAMTGWVIVAPPGYATDEVLQDWVDKGVAFALSLPSKNG